MHDYNISLFFGLARKWPPSGSKKVLHAQEQETDQSINMKYGS